LLVHYFSCMTSQWISRFLLFCTVQDILSTCCAAGFWVNALCLILSFSLVYRHQSFSFYPSLFYEQVPLKKLAVYVVSLLLAQLRHTGNLEFERRHALCNRGVWSARTQAWLTLLRHSSWLWLVVSDRERCISANGNRTTGRSQRSLIFFHRWYVSYSTVRT